MLLTEVPDQEHQLGQDPRLEIVDTHRILDLDVNSALKTGQV